MDHSVSLLHIFPTQNQIVNQINMSFSAALRRLLLPVSLLTVSFSSLSMLLFVHNLFGNSFINSIDLHSFN